MHTFRQTRQAVHQRASRSHRPRLESLEVRNLLSGAGSLDPAFGTGGIVTTAIGSGSTAQAVAVQPSDSRIVAVGSSTNKNGVSQFTAARYTTSGGLDTSFGSGGSVVLTFVTNQYASAQAEAIDGSGKIVLAGYTGTTRSGDVFALTRLNANGSIDTTFGSKGKVVTAVAGYAKAVLIQPDGRILVAGYSFAGAGILARYNANGSPDSTFGSGGVVTTTLGASGAGFFALALQGDGKIIAGGAEATSPNNGPDTAVCLVARLNANGTLDPTFGTGGQVTTPIDGNFNFGTSAGGDGVHGLLIQSNGQIVAAGSVSAVAGSLAPDEVVLARYNVGVAGQSDGSLDTSFGNGGITVTPPPSGQDDLASAAALQADGNIVVGGTRGTGSGNVFLLERYTSAGALDTTFNGSGIVTTAVGSNASAYALAIQPSDGKIIAAGTPQFTLARYLGSATMGATPTATFAQPALPTSPSSQADSRLAGVPLTVLTDHALSDGPGGTDWLAPLIRRRFWKGA